MDVTDAMFLERSYLLRQWMDYPFEMKPKYPYEEILRWIKVHNAL